MSERTEEQAAADHQVAQALRHLNDEWVTALVQGDARTLDRIMADDCVFAYPLEGDDKAQFIADVESGELTVTEMTRDHVGVRVYGQTAVLTCRDTTVWRYHGREIAGQYTTIHVYAERAGRWQMVTIQACPVTH
jgi:ketosteroid isomerase-like protein